MSIEICNWCDGSGDCQACGGDGSGQQIDVDRFLPCEECEGDGRCRKCRGKGDIVNDPQWSEEEETWNERHS